MRARYLRGWAAGVLVVATAASAHAQAQAPGGEAAAPTVRLTATADLFSNYVWRGIRLSEGWVVQPSATLDRRGFSLNAWGNVDLNEYPMASGHSSGRLSEVDVTGSYTRDVASASVTGGFIYYGIRDFADTVELFTTIAFAAPLSPSVSGYYDVDQGDGGFVVVSLGHEMQLAPRVALRLGAYASANFRHKVMGVGTTGDPFTGLYNGEVSAAVSFPLGPRLVVTPKVAYSTPLSDNGKSGLRSASYGGTHQRFYGGMSATATW